MSITKDVKFVIPAGPGYFLLSPDHGTRRDPVVGWALDAQGAITALTPTEMVNPDDDPPILTPTGQVTTYENLWDSVGAWLDSLKAGDAR